MNPASRRSRWAATVSFFLVTISAQGFPSSSINGGWDLGVKSWSPWTADHLALAFYYGPTGLPIRLGGGGGWAFDKGPMGVAGLEVPVWEVWNEDNHSRTWGLVTRASLYIINGEPPNLRGSVGLSVPVGDGFVPTVFVQVGQDYRWQFLLCLNGAVGFE